ncbi:radical SAM protein [candidate division KSB1 bacterium]
MKLKMGHVLCNYYVTYRCNSTCDFCDFKNHGKFRKTPHARLEDFRRNLPDLKNAGVRIIDFTGGEPLLNPALPEMLHLAKQYKFLTTVTTNGMLYPKFAHAIKGLVDLLHFSLDSFDPDLHNKIRGVNCFNHVMRSIELALSLGERPDILFTVTRDNYREMENMYRFANSLGLILILNPVFPYFREETLTDEILSEMENIAKRPYAYLSKGFIKLRREGGNRIDAPLCKAVSRTIVISPMNELLLPCYHYHAVKLPINGNLNALLRSDIHKEQRARQGRMSFCHECTVNCYFEPSFALNLNRYMLTGLPGKIKYVVTKFIGQRKKRVMPHAAAF